MALVNIICQGPCGKRISPSTSIIDVIGQIWCKPCADKCSIVKDSTSTNITDEDKIDIYYRSLISKVSKGLIYLPQKI